MTLVEEKIKYENLAGVKQGYYAIRAYITCTSTREISFLQIGMLPESRQILGTEISDLIDVADLMYLGSIS
jgi:hypothetical protein